MPCDACWSGRRVSISMPPCCSAHRAALRARLDDNEIAAAMVDPDMSFLLPAGPGVFVCVFRVGDDVNVGLMVHLFAHTWLHRDQLYDSQVPLLVEGGEGARLGDDCSCPHRYAACPGSASRSRSGSGYQGHSRWLARRLRNAYPHQRAPLADPAPTGTVSPISCRTVGAGGGLLLNGAAPWLGRFVASYARKAEAAAALATAGGEIRRPGKADGHGAAGTCPARCCCGASGSSR